MQRINAGLPATGKADPGGVAAGVLRTSALSFIISMASYKVGC